MKIIAAIEEPSVIANILTHLGLHAGAPPRSPARSCDLFATAKFLTNTPVRAGSAPELTNALVNYPVDGKNFPK